MQDEQCHVAARLQSYERVWQLGGVRFLLYQRLGWEEALKMLSVSLLPLAIFALSAQLFSCVFSSFSSFEYSLSLFALYMCLYLEWGCKLKARIDIKTKSHLSHVIVEEPGKRWFSLEMGVWKLEMNHIFNSTHSLNPENGSFDSFFSQHLCLRRTNVDVFDVSNFGSCSANHYYWCNLNRKQWKHK